MKSKRNKKFTKFSPQHTKLDKVKPTSKPKKIDCCWENLTRAKHVSRGTWVCPVCSEDVSLMYVFLARAYKDKKSTHKEIITKQND